MNQVYKDLEGSQDKVEQVFLIDKIQGRDAGKAAVNRLLIEAKKEVLNGIWKEVVKNNVAGPVKWELEDRIAELKSELENL